MMIDRFVILCDRCNRPVDKIETEYSLADCRHMIRVFCRGETDEMAIDRAEFVDDPELHSKLQTSVGKAFRDVLLLEVEAKT